MANSQTPFRPWFLDLVPLMVVLLIVAHVLALVYWIYRLATDKQPLRTKRH
ncbi:transmembrane protein [Perilla frutescens var. frutescens]|nr:transmembrane protein [Perilla frutescens var. frutescens]